MRGRGIVAAAVVVGVVLAVAPASPARGPHDPTCKLQGTTIVVDSGWWDIDLAQSDGHLDITYARGAVPCPGGRPRTDAVDFVEIGNSEIEVDLSDGAFGPGLTPEADGTDELEVSIDGGYVNLLFGARADVVRTETSGTSQAISVGPGTADAELTIDERPYDFTRLVLGGGADVVMAVAASTGAETPDFELGTGNDRFTGGAGSDGVSAGGGRDRVLTGGGRDAVDSKGGGRDAVDCGSGRDFGWVDGADRVRSCGDNLPPLG